LNAGCQPRVVDCSSMTKETRSTNSPSVTRQNIICLWQM